MVSSSEGVGSPPPGWYPDMGGRLHWWDGLDWGPVDAPVPEESAGRTLGILVHLGMFFGGFVLPLIVYLTEGNKNRFVRHHASEALNFQITFTIAWIIGFVTLVMTSVASGTGGDASGPPVAVIVLFPLMFLAYGAAAVLSILGAVRASQRRWWRYPVSLRFVKGATAGL